MCSDEYSNFSEKRKGLIERIFQFLFLHNMLMNVMKNVYGNAQQVEPLLM